MLSVKPRSILQLTITGFLSVTGLLFAALLLTAHQLDDLAERNQTLMARSLSALSLGRTLAELSTALERNARQFKVLSDDGILELYKERKSAFRAAANRLVEIEVSETVDSLVSDLKVLEDQAAGRLVEAPAQEINELYSEILFVANRLALAITEWSNLQLDEITAEAEATQRLLQLQGFLLLLVALLLAALFTALITRPLLQVEKAIGQLGDGVYKEKIKVSGPKDLVNLGERLDWLRDRLANLEQHRSSFIRHVSHELKTPLAAIKESASLLEDEVVGELTGKQKEILGIQLKNTSRLQHLIDELLRYHLESFSVINTIPVTIALDELINEVLTHHTLTLRAADIEVRRAMEKIEVQGNRDQIRVVLDNLISNAIKYSPKGGEIDVNLSRYNRHACLEIRDCGPGIAEEDEERIFEAFYQGRRPELPVYGGSGLGLSIAREFIKAHGGSIELKNSEIGACFRVLLPVP